MEKSRKIVEYNADVKLYYTRDTTLKCSLLYVCVHHYAIIQKKKQSIRKEIK